MRVLIIGGLVLLLAGCQSQPMTPEQYAIVQQMMLNNQAAQIQQQRALQGVVQPLPQYTPVAAPILPPPIVNCTTRNIGTTAYTQCQ